MIAGPSTMAEIAALVGDPARAIILDQLTDGRALTATELSLAAGITPQTASAHLGKLLAARLVVVFPQGRHRYYRLASRSEEHTSELQSLMRISYAVFRL